MKLPGRKSSQGDIHGYLGFLGNYEVFGKYVNTMEIWPNIIWDGLSILFEYGIGIVIFFACVFGLGLLILKLMARKDFDEVTALLSSFGIGCIALSLISYIFAILTLSWPPLLRPLSFVMLIAAILPLLIQLWGHKIKVYVGYLFVLVSVGLILLLFVRLAYLTRIILPPYSDSPIHYQIILGIINPDVSNNINLSLGNILTQYYHYGFHALTAWLALTSGLDLSVVIPLMGQMFLVIAPVSVAALTYGLTKSAEGSFFSGLLSAIGWLMPSFSVNWGKFPAMAAISVMPVILLLLWFTLHTQFKLDKFSIITAILVIGITLIHTRIILCLAMAFIGFFISRKLQLEDELGFFQTIRFSLLFVLVLWPLLQPLSRFYSSVPVWIILIMLVPFAFRSYPTASVGISLFLFGLCLVALIPNLVIGSKLRLLDRQFLEMALFVPLSTMGGLGFGGLVKKLELNNILRWGVAIAIFGCVTLNFLQHNSIYPDTCCNYFGSRDEAAFQWIRDELSNNTLFLISTFSNGGKVYGTDAGIWLTPLIQIPTNKLSFNVNWSSVDTLNKICETGASEIYIYSGGKSNSFDDSRLLHTSWALPVFRDGEVAIYKVSNCTN